MPGIVVGVDGSDHSHRALIWAMREAAGQHVPLTVLAVRPDPVRPATGIYWGAHAYPRTAITPRSRGRRSRKLWSRPGTKSAKQRPQVTVNVVTGDPAEELIKASRDADLVVVGSRGSGGFASLLMGSVSSKVTHHAACPVVVIRGEGQAS